MSFSFSRRRSLFWILIIPAFFLAGCRQAQQPTIGQGALSSVSAENEEASAMPEGLTPELLQQFQEELNRQAGQMMQAGSALSGEQASQMMLELQQMMQPPQ